MTATFWIAVFLLILAAVLLWAYRRTKGQLSQEMAKAAQLERTLSFVRNELAEVQTRRKRLLSASTQALIIVEKDQSISSANKVAKKLFGPREKDTTFIEWTRQHQLSELVEKTLEKQKMPPVYFHRGERVLEAHARSIKLKGEVVAVALAIHDVTELHRLGRTHRDFVTNVSHELRTPLASLRLLTETLLNGALDDKEMAIRLIDQMAVQTEILSQLAQELLDLSLIESGQAPLKMTPCALQPVIEARAEHLRPQATRKNLSLQVDVPANITVLIDETMVGRVITNLIHNAVKFTEQGEITVTAKPGPPAGIEADSEGEWVTIAVADSGVGIPPDEIDRIFERFYKVDRARKRPQSGTGLGLAIARHIIEAHGGRIWAKNHDGGATFYFTLPVEEAPVPVAA